MTSYLRGTEWYPGDVMKWIWEDYMKALFRHVSSWLLLIGVTVSFFAFINASDIYDNVQNAADEINEYKYKSMYSIHLSDFFDGNVLLNGLKQIPGNIVAVGNYLYINQTEKYQETEIMIKQNEKLAYPVRIIDKDGDVYIGKKLEEACYKNKGILYIKIENKAYRVAGIVSSNNTDVLNYKIIILNDSQLVESVLEGGSITVECGSNLYGLNQFVSGFYDENEGNAYIDFNRISDRYIEVGSETSNQEFYIVISLFAMINCIVISEFWILRRRKEIIIRKLFGFTNRHLFGYIYSQIVKISAIAVCIILLTEKILSKVGIIDYSLSLKKTILAGLFVIVSSLIVTIIPVKMASDFKLDAGREMI